MPILLIVGNGLSIDLCHYLKLEYSSSYPFQYDVPYPFDSCKKLLDNLDRLKEMIYSNKGKNDFDIIRDFIQNKPRNKREEWTHYELRQYLSLAYSHLNKIILKKWKKNWRWENWIKKHYNKISGIVSFNYDLVVETTLNKLSLNYFRINSEEDNNPIGIPIFKPHGSCDFDISSRAISMPPEIRLKNLTGLNEYIVNGKGIVEIVTDDKLHIPRTEADIVLPFEFSPQLSLTWVRQGYERVEKIAKTADKCVIVGLKYRLCDRQEINRIIDALPKNINIQYISPSPNKELVKKLKTISNKIEWINSKNPRDFFNQ